MIKKIALLGIIVLFTLLFIYCTTDDATILGPFGNADKYITVTNFTADKTFLYSNGDTAFVSIKVLDVDNSPAIGLIVDFGAQFGSITESDTTDSSGIAIAIFISDDNTGENIITADTGIKKYELYLHIVHYQPEYVELFAKSPILLADGISSTIITAVFKDSVGNPMSGITVRFSTTFGTLRSHIEITDNEGVAYTELISSTATGIALVTASSYVTSFVEVEMRIDVPSVLELFPSSPTILADGVSNVTITAIPKDSQGNIMPGVTVRFSTTLGTLSPTLTITNSEGIAETTLTGGSVEGQAYITATAYLTNVTIVNIISAIPAAIFLESSENSILADGVSTVDITATAYNIYGGAVPGVSLDFSTSFGTVSRSQINTDQDGLAKIILTSAGSIVDVFATIKAAVTADTSANENINIQLRGITSITSIDSAKMSDYGTYKAFIRTNLFETIRGDNISSGVVEFSSPIGTMNPTPVQIDEQGIALSEFNAGVLPTNQYDIVIDSELSGAAEVFSKSAEFDIPGAEMLINTIDDEVMGDGEGWALVKATLREITGKAITGTKIEWETTLGTIIGQSKTNSSGHTIDTLRIENAVSQNTNVTVTANYGNNISISDIVTFIKPVSSNRLILGFEPDTTGHGIIPCNIDTALAVREVGVSAQFVNSAGNGVNWVQINFSVVPTNFASICPTDVTENNGLANVMMVYPPQNGGEIVRVWGEAPDGTRGSIDVILPKDAAAVE